MSHGLRITDLVGMPDKQQIAGLTIALDRFLSGPPASRLPVCAQASSWDSCRRPNFGFPAYQLPAGIIAMDLGGTCLRVCATPGTRMNPGTRGFNVDPEMRRIAQASAMRKQADSEQAQLDVFTFGVPDCVRQDLRVRGLFDYVAACVAGVLEGLPERECTGPGLIGGLAFSFAFAQSSRTSARILSLSKGYLMQDACGTEVYAGLQSSFDEMGIPVRVCAVVNDAVAALLAPNNVKPGASVVLASGTNAASWVCADDGIWYAVNTEWGAFWDASYADYARLCGDIGVSLDAQSSNPGKQLFEKLVGGFYLGEIVRLCVLRALGDRAPSKLGQAYSFTAACMAKIECLGPNCVFEVLGAIANGSRHDCVLVADIITAVCQRAALLVASAIVVLAKRCRTTVVVIEGSLWNRYEAFRRRLYKHVADIAPEINLIGSSECSVSGAASAAALFSGIHKTG